MNLIKLEYNSQLTTEHLHMCMMMAVWFQQQEEVLRDWKDLWCDVFLFYFYFEAEGVWLL